MLALLHAPAHPPPSFFTCSVPWEPVPVDGWPPRARCTSRTLRESEWGHFFPVSPNPTGWWVPRAPLQRPQLLLGSLPPVWVLSLNTRICFLHLPLKPIHGFRHFLECFAIISCLTLPTLSQWSLMRHSSAAV